MSAETESLQHVFDSAFAGISQAREAYTPQLVSREVGTITSIATGIAKVSGLPGVGFEEVLKFPGDVYGIAFNVDEDEIGVVLLGDYWQLHAGDEVERRGHVMDVPVGDGLIGRIVNPMGQPLDGKGPVNAGTRLPVERPAPPIMDRAPVTVPLQTGIKVIDALIPVGRGQRELILGDRQTGKTAIALDTILNQRDQNVLCVYCAIGQRASGVAKVVATLREKGAMDYTVVVVTEGNDPPGLAYIAPYAATSIAEYFMEQGRDVLIVYDDLTHHARAYRELSLLLRRPPGREAFPGDIFYIHSRLLERATHLRPELGGGSLTALPIIETEAQDISAYIPTNLISITDGQIYLSPSLFELGCIASSRCRQIRIAQAVRFSRARRFRRGANSILIQENARRDGDSIEVIEPVAAGRHIRPAGLDFKQGEIHLRANSVLTPHALSLAASMGHAALPVRRKPRVAILANGDELVPPGATPGPDQIVSSNGVGLAALVRQTGGEAIDLGIAPDKREAIIEFVGRAKDADILVTSGGASVGEHDLVQEALKDSGMALDFWRIAMRPGKPLMVGRLGAIRVLGLPGNPVSTFVCAELFLKPLIRAMLGLPTGLEIATAKLGAEMPENDRRQDYLRAKLSRTGAGLVATPFDIQDSSMLATLAAADALIVRPIRAPAAKTGDNVPVLLSRPPDGAERTPCASLLRLHCTFSREIKGYCGTLGEHVVSVRDLYTRSRSKG